MDSKTISKIEKIIKKHIRKDISCDADLSHLRYNRNLWEADVILPAYSHPSNILGEINYNSKNNKITYYPPKEQIHAKKFILENAVPYVY